jgi:hypothetical protein
MHSRDTQQRLGSRNHRNGFALSKQGFEWRRHAMKRTLAVLATAATLGLGTLAAPAPAQARHFGWGPGLAFGLAAGALTAGAIAATSPYYWGPDYYYPGPAYYAPGPYAYYAPGPYAYYGGPIYYRHHYWRHHYYRHHW